MAPLVVNSADYSAELQIKQWCNLRPETVAGASIFVPNIDHAHGRKLIANSHAEVNDMALDIKQSTAFLYSKSDQGVTSVIFNVEQLGEPNALMHCLMLEVTWIFVIAFGLTGGRAIEWMIYLKHGLTEFQSGELLLSAMKIWPTLKEAISLGACKLTLREREVLTCAQGGMTARETGEQLHVSKRTVTFHITNAMAKLSATSKRDAVRKAMWLGAI